MPISLYGKNVHKNLINKASKYFSDKGYTVVKEAMMEGRNRIDLLALKGSERIGVECQLTISYKIIKQKFKNYRSSITKMIFIIPAYRETKTKSVIDRIVSDEKISKNFFEIWAENVEIQTTLRISKRTKDLLDSIGSKPESYDDIVKKSVEYYKKRKVKPNGTSR